MSDSREPSFDAGSAGASAGREYERRRASRRQRVQARFGKRLGGVLLNVTDDPQSTQAWASGASGERELAQALSMVEGIRVLHDRCVPGTRGNIDHIVIGPAGVFVIDSKNHEGTVRVRDVGGLFRRDERLFVGRRDCTKLADGLSWQTGAVHRALGSGSSSQTPITPVLCFVRAGWPLFRPPEVFRGVRLESLRSLKKLVIRPGVLDGVAIDQLTSILATALPAKVPG